MRKARLNSKAIKHIKKENRWLLVLLLIAGFLLAFSIPLFFTKVISHANKTAPKMRAKASRSLIVSYRSILGLNKKVKITSTNSLSPKKNEDFLLTTWVKLGRKLQDSEQLVFLGKYNKDAKVKSGYALALRKRGEDIHPLVYWNDDSNKGRWYSFSNIKGIERSWVMFGLSFTDNKYLGLHAVINDGDNSKDNRIELLGGYELSEDILPKNNEKLLLGSIGDSYFKGRFGSLGIFSGAGLNGDLNELLLKLAANPEQTPEFEQNIEIKLWSSDLKRDSSEYNAQFTLNNKNGKKNEKL